METLKIPNLLTFKVDIVLFIVTFIFNVDGYNTLGSPWRTNKPLTSSDSPRLCADILQVTRKLLENDLLRDVIYPKLSDDGMYSKATKIIESRAQPKRNIVHFPSKRYQPGNSIKPFVNQHEYELKLQQQLLNSNRSENSRFKRNGHNQKFYQQHFTKIGSQSSSTINLVPLTVPYEDTSSLEANKQPQAYILDLSSLHESTDDQVDIRSLRPRYYVNQGDHMERRQDDVKEQDEETDGKGETEGESNEPNVVKKTFGYKVTLYKSPNVQEPQVLTEEFFGDGKKKKVIKILKKDEDQASGKTRSEQLSQQPSSSSGRYIPKLGVYSTVDPSDEEEIEASRKLLGAVRKQFASEKGLEAKRTISKSGDETQHDKKGAKEKALREKTQIEFFEREKIFANDDNQKTEREQPESHQFPVMNDRPALVRLTTVAPKKSNRQPITIVSPEDQNNDNDKYNGMDFQSLHDLLLKRLKGWREKGYKITTELEIVQKGAVHDKVRSVRERGKGQQTFQRYERGNAVRGKTPSSYIRSSLDDHEIRKIEPLSVSHNTDNDKMQVEVKENENKQNNQKNLFSNLPKFLLEPTDYEAELDGPEDKVQLQPQNHRRPLHQFQPLQPMQTLPPHPHQHQFQVSQPQLHLSPHSIPHHHQQHHLQHTHSVLLPPPPEALKLQASPVSTGPKKTNLTNFNNTIVFNRPTKGKKYSFKGMTRKVTSEKKDEETGDKNQNVKDGKSFDQSNLKNSEKNKVSSPTTPISTLSGSNEFGNDKVDQNKKASKPKDEQSKRRLAAQKKLKAKAKKKAKLKLKQNQLQNQAQQQQQQGYQAHNQANNVKADRNIYKSPVSIQEQIMFPASPLASNSGRGNENPSIHSSIGIENSLNFFDGFHDSLYMPNENDFDDISFGNPTLISIPGLIDSPNGEQNPQITDHFKLLANKKQIDGNNNQKQNFFNFQDYTEIGKKHRQNGISYEDPLTSHPVSPPHTEILIGTINGPKKLTSPNTGHNSKANKIRNYPTSIQDITRGKKMSNSYTVDPSFGRESPDNLFLSQPVKDSEPMLNQFKNDLSSGKITNEMNSWNSKALNNHRNNNNAKNLQPTPVTLPWYQHEVDNFLQNNPVKTSSWDQDKQKLEPITNNYNQPVDPNLRFTGRDRGGIRFSTPKPISKQKMAFIFDEPLELVTETTRELKPADYPRLTWIEPEADKVKKRKQKKNKSKGLKNKKSNNNVNSYQQQIHQLTDDMISIGFDSQRMRTPKAQDLLMRSSQIYPLIGGYSPFIIPSSANEDFNVAIASNDEVEDDESMNHQDDVNQAEFGLNYVGDDRGKTEEDKKEAVEGIMMKSNHFNTNVNNDNGEDDEYNDDANVNQSESAEQKEKKQKDIPNNPELLIKSKINDENKAKSNYNLISKNERDPDKPSSSQIWSQPCPTCPEL